MRAFVLCCIVTFAAASAVAAEANKRGQRIFGACAACHSLQANKNMTGPSLSGVWGRKSGALESFPRYSPALKSADVVWDDQTLDAWITNPQLVIPGNEMTFPGVRDPQQRVDLLAFLKQATKPGAPPPQMPQMGGMMGGDNAPNLKKLDAEDRIKSIGYCGDTYEIATADGKSRKFWERNLRFKTDSGEDGPASGEPALVGAGMMGDRADVIFSSPEEIAQFVRKSC
jgi:cytochrome c